MNNPETLSLVIGGEQTVIRMYHALDRQDYPGASECFMPDGIWDHGGHALLGQEQILASLSKRSATLFTRHYVSNFVVLEHGGSVAKVAFGLTVYRSDTGAAPTLPLDKVVPALLADVECELACSDRGDWLINRLAPRITFAARAAS
ncbi:MAG: nuclear transport factor 2 family protein [Cupriavidus necator]